MDVDHFIARAQLSLVCEPSEQNTDLHADEVPEDCNHFKCALRGRTHEMEFYFTCPPGGGPPLIQDVTRYLGAVSAEYENCDDILEWADEYGFDPGHMHTRSAFDAIARLTRDLWRVVGDDMFDALRNGIEIEQAVEIAWAGFQNSGRN